MEKPHYVYILANAHNNVLYVGETAELPQRVFRHQSGYYPNAFTKKYNVNKLVYYEEHPNRLSAKEREKRLKRWHHDWKVNIITERNPEWQNLGEDIF